MIKPGCVKSMDKTLIPLMYDPAEERMECPWCHKPDFTITAAAGGYLYNCYHDSCRAVNPSAGFYPTDSVPIEQERRPRKRRKQFTYGTRGLTPTEFAWYHRKYGLEPNTVLAAGVKYAPKVERYVFPIQGPYGEPRGILARRFGRPKDKKKAIAYPAEDKPFAHWAIPEQECKHSVVIVEDYLSALRIQQLDYTALALLGTHLPMDTLNDLIAYKPTEVVIALDPDATEKAFRMQRNIRLYFPKVRVAVLEQDIKDMTYTSDIKFALGIL